MAPADRLEQLRALAVDNPEAARREAWDWLNGIRAPRDREKLMTVFASGTTPAPQSPSGECEGRVLGLFGTPFLAFTDRMARLGQLLGGIGWAGKTFDTESGTGYNRLTPFSRVPMFFVMPRYRFKRVGAELAAFSFDHRIEPTPLSPRQEVRSIVYSNPAYGNPLMLPSTRDELVELVPDVYLGRALLQEDSGEWRPVAYFALREPATGARG